MRIAALLALFGLLLSSVALADDPKIHGLEAEVDGHRVMLDWVMTDAYEIELAKDRKRWFDRPLGHSELQVIAMFDAVTREYLVNYKLDGKLVESRMVHNLDELRQAMTRFDDIPAFTLEPQPARFRMLVKVRALLGSHALFAFIPTRITTDWKESNKFRAPEDLLPPP
jgi:hypothetical protein